MSVPGEPMLEGNMVSCGIIQSIQRKQTIKWIAKSSRISSTGTALNVGMTVSKVKPACGTFPLKPILFRHVTSNGLLTNTYLDSLSPQTWQYCLETTNWSHQWLIFRTNLTSRDPWTPSWFGREDGVGRWLSIIPRCITRRSRRGLEWNGRASLKIRRGHSLMKPKGWGLSTWLIILITSTGLGGSSEAALLKFQNFTQKHRRHWVISSYLNNYNDVLNLQLRELRKY